MQLCFEPSVDLELTGSNASDSLNAINNSGIAFLRVNKIDEITYLIRIRKKYVDTLYILCEKYGDSLRIIRTSPIYRIISIINRHIILVCFLSIISLCTIVVPNRIWFIRVAGNFRISDKEIITAAENCGLTLGMHRRDLRSEKLKNQLLEDIPQLQWVGVNTKGCIAVINVRERFDYEQNEKTEIIANIIAAIDGYILGGTTIRGTALFYKGQSVKKGQTLISAYMDCGQYLKAVRAEGDVFAQTARNISAITPAVCYYRTGNVCIQKKYSLIFGKKRINLWKDSGISDMTCGRIYKEYKICFPGGFDIPVVLCKEIFIDTTIQRKKDLQSSRTEALKLYLDEYLLTQMIAGRILYSDYKERISSDMSIISGSYICHEMIGREKITEFGDFNGENS